MTKETRNQLNDVCGTPGDGIEEILKRFADQESRCKIRTAETAKAMIESGAVNSEREAARVIAEQTGENENTVRQRIKRGKKVGTPVPTPKTEPEKDQNQIDHETPAQAERRKKARETAKHYAKKALIAAVESGLEKKLHLNDSVTVAYSTSAGSGKILVAEVTFKKIKGQ